MACPCALHSTVLLQAEEVVRVVGMVLLGRGITLLVLSGIALPQADWVGTVKVAARALHLGD
jgi:hypothetical protein